MDNQEREVMEQPQTTGSPADDDWVLIQSVLEKDRKATAEFVDRYAAGLYGYVRTRLAPRYDLVDDLLQEIFLSAWENLNQYRGAGSLGAWVMGIARHKLEDHFRFRLRAPESIDDVDQDRLVFAVPPEFPQFVEREQMRRITWRVLSSLRETYRLALIWRYWEKASLREIALKTGKTEKAIERLLARARAEFRERWNHGHAA